MECRSRISSFSSARRFVLLFLLCFVVVGLSYGKECNNVPTERVSHTVRARGIGRGELLDEVSAAERLSQNGESSPGVMNMPKSALISSFRKFLNGWSGRGHREEVRESLAVGRDFTKELKDDVLVEFDDWEQAWTTIAKPMVGKNAQRVENRRMSIGSSGRNNDVPALHSQAVDGIDGKYVRRRSLESAVNRTSILRDVSLHKVW